MDEEGDKAGSLAVEKERVGPSLKSEMLRGLFLPLGVWNRSSGHQGKGIGVL